MTHNIRSTSEAHWSPGDRMAVRVVQTFAGTSAVPWKAIGYIAIGIVCGVALILVPAAIQAARHPIPAF